MGLKSFLERNVKKYDFLDDFLKYVAETVCMVDASEIDPVVMEQMQTMLYMDQESLNRDPYAARDIVELVKYYLPDSYLAYGKVRANFMMNRDAFRR